MKTNRNLYFVLLTFCALGGFQSCQEAEFNQTGSEFIPDMAHSIAYEANVNTGYFLNTWDEESVVSRRALSMPRKPVANTIPRGYSSVGAFGGPFDSPKAAVEHTLKVMKNDKNTFSYTMNGSVPYYYPDTEEGRTQATEEIRYNPFPITADGLARGQELYGYYCGICHGDKGDGGGYLVRDNGGKYPAQPANFLLDDFVNASNGRYYHSIIYGKNAMGPYADKLSYEERWQVIHYIRFLQGKEKKLAYTSDVNELNPEFGVPFASVSQTAMMDDSDFEDMQEVPPVDSAAMPIQQKMGLDATETGDGEGH